jgi:hypothetical protein
MEKYLTVDPGGGRSAEIDGSFHIGSLAVDKSNKNDAGVNTDVVNSCCL